MYIYSDINILINCLQCANVNKTGPYFSHRFYNLKADLNKGVINIIIDVIDLNV